MDRVLIIAEAGVNHNGSIELAKKLIDAAKECGADVVKFQTANADALVSRYAPMAEYQKKNTGKTESQKDMLQKLLLGYGAFTELAAYCKSREIEFLSTPFDLDSIDFLEPLVRFWKVPSGEITNLPYLIKIASTRKSVVLSTGMSTLSEVREAVDVLRRYGTEDITLLHCTTQYPTPYDEVNLNAMLTLKKEFGVSVGYSDHTKGIEIPIAAAAMGAVVLEKHFTLDCNMEGPDHKASLEPNELAAMVRAVRNVEAAMGSFEKKPSPSESANIAVARKSIVAACAIKKGDVFTEHNLTTKRPGSGISPMKWHEVLGTKAIRDFGEDELIEI